LSGGELTAIMIIIIIAIIMIIITLVCQVSIPVSARFFLEAVGLERGLLSLMRITEVHLE
jgi:hypothetical protein